MASLSFGTFGRLRDILESRLQSLPLVETDSRILNLIQNPTLEVSTRT